MSEPAESGPTSEPEIALRAGEDADLARLVELLLAQFREHEIPTPAAAVAAGLGAMLRDPAAGFVLVATVDGAIEGVAYVSFARPLEHAGEVAWLEELYVTPERRNLGLGRRLVGAVIERAEARGCVSMDLEVEAAHARAGNLYERAGFRPMRRTHWVRPLKGWDW